LSAHTTGEAIVRVDCLSKRYGRVRALDDVAFLIRAESIDAAMRW
jgi:ABC-type sugar transport system ATPase subunit